MTKINIKTPAEIKVMAEGGKILAAVLRKITAMVRPSITTLELDKTAETLILSWGAKPAFKGYKNFPFTLCTSINDEIIHSLPSERKLQEGDIVTLDLGVLYKGFNTDAAVTLAVGKVPYETKRLMEVTKESLNLGIRTVKEGIKTGDLGNTIQSFIESRGFGVVRKFCGHGIGREIHEDPQVPNYGKRGYGIELKEGMVICIEPMVTIGDYNVKKSRDEYGYATLDGSLSAHFEHTVAVTKNGATVLTDGI